MGLYWGYIRDILGLGGKDVGFRFSGFGLGSKAQGTLGSGWLAWGLVFRVGDFGEISGFKLHAVCTVSELTICRQRFDGNQRGPSCLWQRTNLY